MAKKKKQTEGREIDGEREPPKATTNPPYGTCHCMSVAEVTQKPQKSPNPSFYLLTHKTLYVSSGWVSVY